MNNSSEMRYFSNESLEDRHSTTSSTEEGSINVERRKVGGDGAGGSGHQTTVANNYNNTTEAVSEMERLTLFYKPRLF